jgi:hypothetical protein
MPARKPIDEIPRASGIYQILCKPNRQIYVGSAVDLRMRWDVHRREPHKGTHHNFYLQRAQLHGEENSEFMVLEYVETTGLLSTVITPDAVPAGKITNLAECDLCAVHMFEVKSGQRPSHKGWTWRKPDENQTYQ